MEQIFGNLDELGWIALKAVLLYLTVFIGFRASGRRTLADLSALDFVAAVAAGSIVGRVPNAHDASYLAGLATLGGVLVAHRALLQLRSVPLLARWLEAAPVVVVAKGEVLEAGLRRCHLTREELFSLLRRHGIGDLSEVRYAIMEQRGQISIIRAGAERPEPGLVPAGWQPG